MPGAMNISIRIGTGGSVRKNLHSALTGSDNNGRSIRASLIAVSYFQVKCVGRERRRVAGAAAAAAWGG